jgi:rfaE bifunctional protein kinase chain/domain
MHSILIVGDVIIDEYIHGDVSRISPEAPVPVLNFHHREFRPGGAANVAANVESLGCRPILVGVIGGGFPRETTGPVYPGDLIYDHERHTTIKTRVVAAGQQIVRIDRETERYLSPAIETKIVNSCTKIMNDVSVVVISDYNKGVINEMTAQSVIKAAMERGIPVIVDPKKRDFSIYEGATVITPNGQEYLDAYRQFAKIEPAILVTLGSLGMDLHLKGSITRIPTKAKSVVDVTGAGDTVVAALATFIATNKGKSLMEAAVFANAAAAVVVGKRGTATVTLDEMGM